AFPRPVHPVRFLSPQPPTKRWPRGSAPSFPHPPPRRRGRRGVPAASPRSRCAASFPLLSLVGPLENVKRPTSLVVTRRHPVLCRRFRLSTPLMQAVARAELEEVNLYTRRK